MSTGSLFIISGPSGVGKTRLVDELIGGLEHVALSVSCTTRAPRPGERDGEQYHFVSPAEFARRQAARDFLEWAQVFDHQYGTPASWVRGQLDQGTDVVLEIDWQGARQVREHRLPGASVMILPPSVQALQQRLSQRGDRPEAVARRMRDAHSELAHWDKYDYLVFNDDFERAVEELRSILLSRRLLREQQQERALAFMAAATG